MKLPAQSNDLTALNLKLTLAGELTNTAHLTGTYFAPNK